MRLNKLLMKYTKLTIKQNKVYKQIISECKKESNNGNTKISKQALNTLYGIQNAIYSDTDTIVDGMKYTE